MENTKSPKILITGVHTTPALAVLDELAIRGHNNFVWVGRKQFILGTKEPSLEYNIVTKRGIKFINLTTGKLQRTIDLSFFLWLARIPIGFIQALFVLIKERPSLIITFGSYVGVPITFWGWIMRIKIIDHEQVLVGGLSNQIISKLASKVCLSWKDAHIQNHKYVYTGNPINKKFINAREDNFKFAEPQRKTLFLVAGKTGSHILNLTMLGSVEKLTKKYNVIHQTGSNPITDDFANAETLAKSINSEGIKYIPIRNYTDGEGFAKSDIVISRGGANTIYDLAVLGKVSILVPIPFTYRDEQTKNSELLVEAGTGKILHQNILTPDTLISTIDDVSANFESMLANADRAKLLTTLDADKRIADIAEQLLPHKKNFNLSRPTKYIVTEADLAIKAAQRFINKIKSATTKFTESTSLSTKIFIERNFNRLHKNDKSSEEVSTAIDPKVELVEAIQTEPEKITNSEVKKKNQRKK